MKSCKEKTNQCSSENCSKKARTKNLCPKHYQIEYRKNNLMKYAYSNLKNNAKRRGHEFSLTFEEFSNFAIETRYIAQKGREKTSYSIDRIDNSKGYHIDNIQVLTVSENSKKYTKVLTAYYDEEQRKIIATVNEHWMYKSKKESKQELHEDCPF